MAKQLKELVLFEGEEVLYQIEGNAYTVSSSPIAKLMAGLNMFIMKVFGVTLKTHIVATNKRVIRINKKTILWGMMTGEVSVFTLNKKTIQTIGYQHTVRWFFIKTSYFALENTSSSTLIAYKGKKDELGTLVAEFSRLVLEQ